MVKQLILTLILGFSAFSISAGEKQIEMRIEIYSVPQVEAIELTENPDEGIDATELIKKVRALVKNGDGKLVTTTTTISRSGRRSKVSNGEEYRYIAGYRVSDNLEQPVEKTAYSGTVFEVDPVLDPDNVTLDINLALSHSNDKLEIRKQTMTGPVSGKELPFETVILNQAKVTTAVILPTGKIALIGTVNNTDGGGQVLMAFLKADIREAL